MILADLDNEMQDVMKIPTAPLTTLGVSNFFFSYLVLTFFVRCTLPFDIIQQYGKRNLPSPSHLWN